MLIPTFISCPPLRPPCPLRPRWTPCSVVLIQYRHAVINSRHLRSQFPPLGRNVIELQQPQLDFLLPLDHQFPSPQVVIILVDDNLLVRFRRPSERIKHFPQLALIGRYGRSVIEEFNSQFERLDEDILGYLWVVIRNAPAINNIVFGCDNDLRCLCLLSKGYLVVAAGVPEESVKIEVNT